MTRRELLDALARYGMTPRDSVARRTAHEQVVATTQTWRGPIERELLSTPIKRQEAATLVDLMTTTGPAIVVGAGGGGKTSVLYQAAREGGVNPWRQGVTCPAGVVRTTLWG
jgi:hypothetical protein